MGIKNLFFPAKCVLCGYLLRQGEVDFCHRCRCHWPQFGRPSHKVPYTDRWTAVWKYQDEVRDGLLRFKFGGRQSYAEAYGKQLALTVQRTFEEPFDCVVYVPISWRRRLKRGYDQVELLAQVAARELGLPCVKAVRKIRHTPPQSGIEDAAMRRANVLNAYRVIRPEAVAGHHLLLIDDIVTTGATMGECARMLRLSGAKTIHGLSVAAKA